MDEHDIFAAKSPTKQENDLFGFEKIDGTINVSSHDQKEDSSSVIENNPDSTTVFQPDLIDGDNSTSALPTATLQSDVIDGDISTSALPAAIVQSDVLGEDTETIFPPLPPPTTSNDDLFWNQSTENEPSITLPPTAEDIFSDNQSEKNSSVDMFSNSNLSVLQAFNERRQKEIAEKDAEENKKIEELRQQAKQDLERWHKERERQMEQTRKTVRHDEDGLRTKLFEKSTKESCDWTKVIHLLDFSQGAQLTKSRRDISRMRSCIITSKHINDAKQLANGV